MVAKKDVVLATRIEEAMRKNESLESLSVNSVRRDIARARITELKGKNEKLIRDAKQRSKIKADSVKLSLSQGVKSKKASVPAKSGKAGIKVSKSVKLSSASSPRKTYSSAKKVTSKRTGTLKSSSMKLNVVGFRGRSSWSNKKEPSMSR